MANEFIVRNGLIALDNSIITGSLTVTGGITGSLLGIVSYALDSNLLDGQDSSVFATTGSNQFNGNQTITGSLTVTGQITAQTLNVQQVTSSIVYSSGSNVFGNSLSDTQQLTGSVSVTGSMNVNGTPVSVGTGSNGQVTFWNGTSSQTGDNGLFWDNGNRRLGIGTNTPSSPGLGSSPSLINIFRASGNSGLTLTIGTNAWDIANVGGIGIYFINNNSTKAILFNNGNLAINTTTDAGFRLDVNGTARIVGATRIDNLAGTGTRMVVADANGVMSTQALGIAGTIATGQVAFGTDAGVIGGDSGLFWDNVNKRLGIGTNNPLGKVHSLGSIVQQHQNTNGITNAATASQSLLFNRNGNTVSNFYMGYHFGGYLSIGFTADSFSTYSQILNIFSNGNICINTTDNAGFRLDVNGTARITSTLQTDVDAIFNGVNVGRGGGNIVSNVRVGINALSSNTTGIQNTANGINALFNNTTGNSNTANGVSALLNNTTGSDNTAIGYNSGRYIADGITANTISNNSVYLGAGTRALANNQTNQIVIGYNAIGLGSNSVVLGNDSITFTGLKGNVGINTTTNAGFRLDVNGTARVQGNLTLTPSASSNYQINSSVFSGRLGFQNLNTIQDCFIDLFSNATGNRSVGFAVWAKGIPTSSTNIELLEFRYDATNTRFALNILQGGTGVLRPFHIYTGENTNQLKIQTNGNVSINSASDVASAQLQIDSTTRGFLPPRMTTTQKNAIASPATGLVVYDNTLNKLSVFTGLVWETITST